MRAVDGTPKRHRPWAVAITLVAALALSVSVDGRLDPSRDDPTASPALVTDEMPPAVVPGVVALAVVWVAFAAAGCAPAVRAHRRARSERDRGPPPVAVLS